MNKRIIFKNTDGTCGVIIPSENYFPKFRVGLPLVDVEDDEIDFIEDDEGNIIHEDLSEDEALEKLAAKDVPEGLEWRIIDLSELPESRNYRLAWFDDGEMKIDLEKAKPLQRALAIQKAHERTDEVDRINVFAEIAGIDFNSAQTLDELYNLWPASIENRSEPRKFSPFEAK